MPLAIIPKAVKDLPERWRSRVSARRELSDVDPAADALAKAATELDAAIRAAEDESKTLTTAEYGAAHFVAAGTVRKWCERGELAGAAKNPAGDWQIPAGAMRHRTKASA